MLIERTWVPLGLEAAATAPDWANFWDGSFRRRMSIIGGGTCGGLAAAPSRTDVVALARRALVDRTVIVP
jgi:hypothetical protein